MQTAEEHWKLTPERDHEKENLACPYLLGRVRKLQYFIQPSGRNQFVVPSESNSSAKHCVQVTQCTRGVWWMQNSGTGGGLAAGTLAAIWAAHFPDGSAPILFAVVGKIKKTWKKRTEKIKCLPGTGHCSFTQAPGGKHRESVASAKQTETTC